jgi:glycosyltransferase involved in cell wall biosynthesis/MoaA/NifB/PqqE/SkfB family radical SAM enzyme
MNYSILKIIHGYPPLYNAGSEVYSQSICNELVKRHKVVVFTREEDPFRPDFEMRTVMDSTGVIRHLINMARGKDGFRHEQVDEQLRKVVLQHRPDVAHIGHLNHLSTGIVDVLREEGIPIVFTLHDFWLMCPRGQFLQRNFGEELHALCEGQSDRKCAENCYSMYCSSGHREEELNYWTTWVSARMAETRGILDKVDRFIAPSRYLMHHFITDFQMPAEKIEYLDYGFPLEYLQKTRPFEENRSFTFGYIGTHIPAKGVNLLISAFKKLNGSARLIIWGHKDAQSTAALKAMADDNSGIEFRGPYINQNLADEVFAHVDVIVVPSIWTENSPLVIHEAQACGIPVITADVGGMKEYVEHQVNGLLFRHRDFADLAMQMQTAMENPELMKALGTRGYLYHENGHVPCIKEHCEQLERMYEKVISSSRPKELWRITIDTNPEDCNLECVMCEEHSPHSTFIEELYKKKGIRRRRMPVAQLEDIFRQASALGVREIIPSTMGEPLIYKGINRIYELAKEHGILINLTTNGTFPGRSVKDWAEIIIPQTSDVKISWNGATRETAEKVMIGIDFEQVLANLKEFIVHRDLLYAEKGHYCRITLQLTFMRNNMHELSDIIRLAALLGVDRVKGHHLWDHFEEIRHLSFVNSPEGVKEWNELVVKAHETADQFRSPDGKKVLLENIVPLELTAGGIVPDEYDCPFLGKEIWISAEGEISPCCAPDQLRRTLGDFGNIRDRSLHSVMSGELYQDLLLNFRNKEVCKHCKMRKPQ